MKTIPIENLLGLLKRTDLRAVRNWCKHNGVLILKQAGCEFVIESEFREVYERPFVEKLKRKFGADWESAYSLYKDGHIPALHILNDLTSTPVSIYKTNSSNKSNFTKKLEEYERKKKNAA